MAFEITVLPSQHTFVAEAGETILNAALRQGVLLPYGCGDGACGACRQARQARAGDAKTTANEGQQYSARESFEGESGWSGRR